jgi:hypothetical protein
VLVSRPVGALCLVSMRFSHFLRAAPCALVLSAAAGACSSSQPPQAYARVLMSASPTSPGNCVGFVAATPVIAVGNPAVGGANPMPASRVANGAQQVTIACTVRPSGSGYVVDVIINQANTMGSGAARLEAYTAAGQVIDPVNGGTMNVVTDLTTTTSGAYHFDTCSISFNTPSAGSPSGSYIAAGRIWAHLSCDGIVNMTSMTGTPPMPSTCDAEADLIFENCGT